MNAKLDSGRQPRGFARSTGVIRERWWPVLLTIIIVGALSFGVSLLLPPKYSATAQLSYSQDEAQLASQALSSAGTTNASHNVANDALILQTSTFAERVGQAMGGSVDANELRTSITVSSNRDSDLIEVTASGSDRLLVADIANAFAREFVKARQENSQKSLLQAQELLKSRIDSMTDAEAGSAYGISLKERYDDLAVLMSLEIKDYEIIQEATAATSAYFPRPYFNLLLGLAAGLIIGLLVAFVLDRLDRRIKDQSTLEQIMNLPVIGTIPRTAQGRNKSGTTGLVVGFTDGNEALLESMRMLRSNLKVLGFGESKRSVLISSVGPGEGKSTLAINLALSMALAGDRVVLVDADFRNPVIHQYLGIPNSEGLGDMLLERNAAWSSKIKAVDLSRFVSPEIAASRQSTGKEAPISKFLCLTTGITVGNPSEILESEAMMDVLAELQGISDYVIIDAPPMLEASDSLVLARSVDALVLASMLGRDTADEVVEVRQLLSRAEITPLGIVICGAKRHSRDGHRHYPLRTNA
jgi:Mrp family chromosome partitioning ATPase/capsular polysaccharide biosynthesis protein